MDISYELYRVFYQVASTLSFSEAAANLYISQSAVSQSIKALETRLGQTLFLRSTKRVSLTPEGELLYKHIEPAIRLIVRGEQQLQLHSHDGMQLRIAASDTICRYYLVPYLQELHREYPDIHIQILNGTSLRCARLLETGEADFAVVNSPNYSLTAQNFHVEPVRSFCDIFVGNPDFFPDCFTRPMTRKELSELPILMLSKHSATSQYLHEQFRKYSLELAPSIELSSNDLLLDLAKIGLGIACVPDFCVPRQDTTLRQLPLSEPLAARSLLLAYDKEATEKESGRYFAGLLQKDA